ncbi:MAG TPA: hypothetical protein VF970_10550 [Gemmatimonadales bacterium]
MTDREPENVDPSALTCEQVDERDLEAAYLASRLAEPDTEAFEAHVFGCDRCWALLQSAQVVAGAAPPRPAAVSSPRRRRLTIFLPLAAAAGIAALLLVRSPSAPVAPGVPQSGALRGDGDSLPVRTTLADQQIEAVWPALSRADVYQLRLYAPDGSLLLQRETRDTIAAVAVDSLRLGSDVQTVYWQVQALDQLRQPLARSPLTPVTLPAR